jgi:uncharacterized integral membrane protein
MGVVEEPTVPAPSPRRRGKATGTLILTVVVLLLLFMFVITNSQSVPVSLAFWDVSAPLWLLVLLSLIAGVLIGWSARWWTARK